MKATSVPSSLRTMLGWMLPNPIIGLLATQVAPLSSLMATIETENVSE
jgi:hypothetical protein